MSKLQMRPTYPRTRKYPKVVIVRDMPWRVKFVRNCPGSRTDLGLCCPSQQTIYIKLKQKPKETFMTFIHELLHAFEFEYDFNIPHKAIEQLEKPISEFVLDNWDLIADALFSRL
jgi:hypothetical protein